MSRHFVARLTSWLWTILLQFLVAQQLPAQENNVKFHNIQLQEALPNNSVLAITQDQTGFMWFGTYEGLCRYDGHRITTFTHRTEDDSTLPSNHISSLLTDRKGRVWVGTENGLGLLHSDDGSFTRFMHVKKASDIRIVIRTIFEDRNAGLWLGTSQGVYLSKSGTGPFQRLASVSEAVGGVKQNITAIAQDRFGYVWVAAGTYLGKYSSDGRLLAHYNYGDFVGKEGFVDTIRSMAIDEQDRIWIGAQKGIKALFDIKSHQFVRQNIMGRLAEDELRVLQMISDQKGGMWVAGGNGVNYFNVNTLHRTSYRNQAGDPNSLSDNGVMSIFLSQDGILWIGTYNSGVQYMLPEGNRFKMVTVADGLSYNIVSSVSESSSGDLLIATSGGGVNWWNRDRNQLSNIPHLQRQWVYSAYVDPGGDIWVGSNGLQHYSTRTKTWRHFRNNDADPRSISSDVVLKMLTDYKGRLWVATSEGLDRYDRDNDEFVHIDFKHGRRQVYTLLEDSGRNLWVGASNGLIYMLNTDSGVFRKVDIQPDPNFRKPENSAVCAITEDIFGSVWIGGHELGLKKYNPSSGIFENFNCPGLYGQYRHILSMQADGQGRLWLGMQADLVMVDPADRRAVHFDKRDNISISEFGLNGAFRDSKGLVFFGTNKGLLYFDPKLIGINRKASRIVWTGLQVNGRQITAGDSSGILRTDIASTDRLMLDRHHHFFTVSFSLLNYVQSDKNSYEYKLEGVDSAWRPTKEPSVTFNDLAPGTYKLSIRGYNNDKTPGSNQAVLTIVIAPPWWQSWWAYLSYFILTVLFIAGVFRLLWIRASFRQELQLHQAKINFFTNISHEIRTHLTLVIAPLSHLLAGSKPRSATYRTLKLAHSNSERLLVLATELLDFRRIENGQLKLCVSQNDIVSSIRHLIAVFDHVSLEKNVTVGLVTGADTIMVYFDPQQLDKAIFNILSNAFKFVGQNGHVNVDISEGGGKVIVRISNDGKPIAAHNIDKLFKNYLQSYDYESHNDGYGIGLALAKSIVQMHHGTLAAQINDGYTCFEIMLPKGHSHFSPQQLLPDEELYAAPHIDEPTAQHYGFDAQQSELQQQNEGPTILIAEDNVELLDFIASSLNGYKIFKCTDGNMAWELILEHTPDLVLTDVMMPGLNGTELCRLIKTDQRTRHIPVVVLTAKGLPEQILEALEAQADHYILKPFDLHELELRISNLLALSRAVRQRAVSDPSVTELENKLSNRMEREFVEKLTNLIHEHMTSPQFGADMLAREMGMGRSVFFKRVKSVTGISVNDFAKIIRIEKAAELLRENVYHVNEVAEMVGFSDRRYFSKEFARIIGETPSQYIRGSKK